MKNWKNIKWKINNWFYWDSPIYVSLNFNILFSEWKKVRKYFRQPHIKYYTRWRTDWKKIFRLELHELSWKTKYGMYRHEEDPFIALTLFGYTWVWKVSPDMNGKHDVSLQYYETILWLQDYLKKYDNPAQALYKAVKENTWSDTDNKPVDCTNMLTRYGKQLYITYSSSVASQQSNHEY